jgi:hypothetical protein
MRIRKIAAALLLIIGVGMIGFSMYIMNQVNEGKIKIESAEKTVGQANQLFSLNPVTKQLGEGVTGSAEKKIESGKELIARYVNISQNLKIAGIVLIVLGVGLFFVGKRK